ncbi:penicillin-binding protein 1C [Oceanospirillum linum]|uniref:penicillin-binding protein 1C n=1 Tax=Oceanospirillum linum TaxID=966 RepID=UPI001357EF75|nr:penicillin-binding protein 1C [Oceanospirillum linum]
MTCWRSIFSHYDRFSQRLNLVAGRHPWVAGLSGLLLFCCLLTMLSLGVLDRIYPLSDVLPKRGALSEREGAPKAGELGFAQAVVDRYKRPLRAFPDHKGLWRYQVGLGDVAPDYLKAVINYEDRWFYYHPGFNPFSVVRAAWQNWRCGCIVSGGSTITMQVARRLDPHRRSLGGKLHQVLRAVQLEWHLSKEDILTLYLNYVPMGGVIEGVEAASRLYLDRSASELSLAQSALLAVLPQAPSRLRPDRYPERAQAARDKVLQRLYDFGVIDRQAFERAKLEAVAAWQPDMPILAPLLARKLHQQYPDRAVIQTTLDADIQAELQTLLQEDIQLYPKGHSAAILVADNATGEVVAYVGSADFLNQQRFGHVDMVQAIRSPGSTLKPFIYGLALEAGVIHSASLLRDTPRYQKEYQPENFARAFSGAVDTHTALRQSLNLPVVQVLEALTPERFAAALANVRTPYRMPAGSRPNLAMALGGGGFNLWDLVTLYSGLANKGQVKPLTALFQPSQEQMDTDSRWLISGETSWVVARLLRNARPDQTHNPSIRTHAPGIAWKTGTSYGFRDAWAVGVTPKLTIGVWVGRPDGTPAPGYFGAITALPILFRIQDFLDPDPVWGPMPDGVSMQSICWPLGLLSEETASEHCHVAHQAWVIRKQVPPTLRDDAMDGLLPNPLTIRLNENGERLSAGCLPARGSILRRRLALWPQPTEPWIPRRWRLTEQLPPLAQGCETDSLMSAPLHIIGLKNGERLLQPESQRDQPQPLQLVVSSVGGLGERDWFLNGRHQGRTEPGGDLPVTFHEPGDYELVALDQQGHIKRVRVQLEPSSRR